MKDLELIKSNLEEYLELLKAKKRNDGETWTQPSGRKVTKKNGKIVPVAEGGNNKKEKDSTTEKTKLKESYKNYKLMKDIESEIDSNPKAPISISDKGMKMVEKIQNKKEFAKKVMEHKKISDFRVKTIMDSAKSRSKLPDAPDRWDLLSEHEKSLVRQDNVSSGKLDYLHKLLTKEDG